MFSCFCTKKKFSNTIKSTPRQQLYLQHNDTSKNNQQIIYNDPLSTFNQTPTLSNSKSYENLITYREEIKQSINHKPGQIKRISSVKQVSNQSGSILGQVFSSDSQTIPYKSKKQVSQLSTPSKHKYNHKRSSKNLKRSKQSTLSKQLSLSRQLNNSNFRYSRTNNENIIDRYFSFDRQGVNFHTRPVLKMSNGKISNVGSASIDYSKYSQQDRQISSNEILDINQQIQTKLHQLEQLPLEQAKSRMSQSQRHQLYITTSRFHKQNIKYQIQNDFQDLQKIQKGIHKNIMTKSNAITKSIYKGSCKVVKFSASKQQHHRQQEIKQKTHHQFIQRTVMTQLDQIQENQNLFFVGQQSLKAPQSLDTFRKNINNQQLILMDQTLEQAENAFNCNSVNQQFSRSIITKQFDLAIKIFERMTIIEKNYIDTKGFCPVHLVILKAIVDEKAFDLAKKLMYNPQVKLNIKGPTGWSPLQEVISYKHIRLTPNVFVASHKKKLSFIRQTLASSSQVLLSMKDFELSLDVKVDSFIPLVGNLTPNDTIVIIKKGNKLLIDYTLVGYEFLSCKRRDMGFLISNQTIYAINRSKQQYCDLLQQLDKQQVQMLVVQSLQTQTKKIDPCIKNADMKQAKTIFDNQIFDQINNYKAKKYFFSINYTSMTEKRMPEKLPSNYQIQNQQNNSPLRFLTSWENYLNYQHKVNIKPKNRNKKIELQMWLSDQFSFEIQNLIKIFQLFALSNPLAKTISDFLTVHFNKLDNFKGKFPVKIDIPINFSLYFNLEFKGLKFNNFKKQNLQLQQNLQKISRKQFQNISQSKEKRAFAISAFT